MKNDNGTIGEIFQLLLSAQVLFLFTSSFADELKDATPHGKGVDPSKKYEIKHVEGSYAIWQIATRQLADFYKSRVIRG